jgi:hypothetical protein
MADLTYHATDLADYWIDYLGDRKDDFNPAIKTIFYGDQEMIPETPALCIEPAEIERELQGVPFQTQNTLQVAFIVYNAGLGSMQDIQRATDLLAEDIIDVINRDSLPVRMDGTGANGLVTQGWVTNFQMGYAMKANMLMRADRFIWTGTSKTNLVNP